MCGIRLSGEEMISVTEHAAEKVKELISKRGRGIGIRVGVKTTGCSGLAYALEFIDETRPEDLCFESNGVTIYTDPKSLVYVKGTEMEWVKKGINAGFEFINPNERDRCGCGESFRT